MKVYKIQDMKSYIKEMAVMKKLTEIMLLKKAQKD